MMDLIVNNAYLAVFSAGTLIGASSTFFIMKFLNKCSSGKKAWSSSMEGKFEFDDPNDEYRLILGIRNDLKMQKGKVAAQCGHASVAAYAKALDQRPKTLKRWLRYGGTKITVRIDSEAELFKLDKEARNNKILSSIIRDAGQTQVAPGSRTVIAIGPAPKSQLDKVTGHLKLY